MVRESSHCPEHRGDMREVSVCVVDWIVLRAESADGKIVVVKIVKYTVKKDERSAAEIAAVWPGDGGADMLRRGLLYHCYCINEVCPFEVSGKIQLPNLG